MLSFKSKLNNTTGNKTCSYIPSKARTNLRQLLKDNIPSDAVQSHVPILPGKNDIRRYFGGTAGIRSCPNISSVLRTSLKQSSQDNISNDAVQTHIPNVPRNLKECSATQSTNQIVPSEETIQVQDFNQSDAKKNKT